MDRDGVDVVWAEWSWRKRRIFQKGNSLSEDHEMGQGKRSCEGGISSDFSHQEVSYTLGLKTTWERGEFKNGF